MVGEERPLLSEILGQTDPVEAKAPIFQLIFARSAWTPSDKSAININRKSTARFQ